MLLFSLPPKLAEEGKLDVLLFSSICRNPAKLSKDYIFLASIIWSEIWIKLFLSWPCDFLFYGKSKDVILFFRPGFELEKDLLVWGLILVSFGI